MRTQNKCDVPNARFAGEVTGNNVTSTEKVFKKDENNLFNF